MYLLNLLLTSNLASCPFAFTSKMQNVHRFMWLVNDAH